MRSVEEIRADIEALENSPSMYGNEWKTPKRNRLYGELVSAYSIPLARLSEICAAEKDGRCVVLPDMPQDMDNPLEPLKVVSALRSEIMKYEFRAKNRPQDLSILDYTIIKALEDVITRAEADAALKGGADV